MAHARRKFHELWANHHSQFAEEAPAYFGRLYFVERDVHEATAGLRRQTRQERASPVADALRRWLALPRLKVPDGSATAKAIDYSLRRWGALT